MRIGHLLSSLFAATANGAGGLRVQGTNLSELSMGWTITLPVAVGTALLAKSALRHDRDRHLIVGAFAAAIVLTSWTIVRWPEILANATLLTLVPPSRLAPHIGFFGVTTLVLLIGDADRWERVRRALDRFDRLILLALTLGLTAWAATELEQLYLPTISQTTVLTVLIAAGALIGLMVSRRTVLGLSLFAATSVLIASFVNPLMIGVGDIQNSTAANELRRLNREMVQPVNGTWAGDDIFLVPLLNGNGFNVLSSYNDPVDRAGWEILDPEGRYETAWNRLGYILFEWRPNRQRPEIANPGVDVVVVRIDPCHPSLDALALTMVITTRPITAPCLVPITTIMWTGTERTVWRRLPSGG